MTIEILRPPVLKIAAHEKERQDAITFLKQQQLPVSDIHDNTLLYVFMDAEKMIGSAGLEIFDDCALLRSVGLVQDARGKGYGKILHEQVEHFAKEKGINCLYLITTTAEKFFDRQGYCIIDRTMAPDAIKQTDQFTGLCPSSAMVMKKHI